VRRVVWLAAKVEDGATAAAEVDEVSRPRADDAEEARMALEDAATADELLRALTTDELATDETAEEVILAEVADATTEEEVIFATEEDAAEVETTLATELDPTAPPPFFMRAETGVAPGKKEVGIAGIGMLAVKPKAVARSPAMLAAL
jgi:hypothetical protein